MKMSNGSSPSGKSAILESSVKPGLI